MAFRNVCNCDTCGKEIDISNGDHPARINACAPTPSTIGQQQEESDMCLECWKQLCTLFPRFKDAERFTLPQTVSAPKVGLPLTLDSVTKEGLLVRLAELLGVQVVQTPDAPAPAPEVAKAK